MAKTSSTENWSFYCSLLKEVAYSKSRGFISSPIQMSSSPLICINGKHTQNCLDWRGSWAAKEDGRYCMWYPEQGTKRASTAHTVAILIRIGHDGSPQVYSGMNITLRLLSLGRAVHNDSRLSVYRLHQPPRGSTVRQVQKEWDSVLTMIWD